MEDLELTALDERRALAALRIRMLGAGSGADTSMRLWDLLTVDDSRRVVRVEEFSDEAAALAAARR